MLQGPQVFRAKHPDPPKSRAWLLSFFLLINLSADLKCGLSNPNHYDPLFTFLRGCFFISFKNGAKQLRLFKGDLIGNDNAVDQSALDLQIDPQNDVLRASVFKYRF